MDSKWFSRALVVAVVTLTLAAVFQELEKPEEERKWHGKAAGIIPYDFRIPTLERLREVYWNPYERRVFMPRVFGIGWAINFYTLLENLGVLWSGVSQEDFLMPTRTIRDLLEHLPTSE